MANGGHDLNLKRAREHDDVGAQPAGYKGFGSFFSDNVEDMINADSRWVPEACVSLPELPHSPPTFGKACRSLFMIDFENWTFVNHGAFGGPSRYAFEHADAWRRRAELQPLRFFDRELLPQLAHATRLLAPLLNSRPRDVALVTGVTAGLNAVINATALRPGESLYSLDIGYGSVKKMLAARAAACGDWVEATVPLPTSADALVALVESTLPSSGCRLAVFCGITSNTALVLPCARLAAIAHARGARVLIDGAHLMGTTPIDVTSIGADYFVTNLHKWFSSPRGCGLLWAVEAAQDGLRPTIVSHGATSGFASSFVFDGNRDYSPACAAPAAVRFWDWMGLPAVHEYQRALLRESVALLTGAWGTEALSPPGGGLTAAMALVQLPAGAGVAAGATDGDAVAVQNALHAARVECPIKIIAGRLYARISCHVYNCVEDYQRLAVVVASPQVAKLLPAAPRVGQACTRGGGCG